MAKKYTIYEVGGSIRDGLLGEDTKDRDFVVIFSEKLPENEGYHKELERIVQEDLGGTIYLSKPEYLTVRCKVPVIGDCDFVVGRVDGFYSDQRRPDSVDPCHDIEEELSRRDFTVNAMARNYETGEIIDPFGGAEDLTNGLLRTVGFARSRFKEDPLRLIRALRFSVTKSLTLDEAVVESLNDYSLVKELRNSVSIERTREELYKCFAHDTWETLKVLGRYEVLRDTVFWDSNLWLEPSLKKKR